MKSQKQRMLQGELYMANDPDLKQDFARCRQLMRQFNQSSEIDLEDRTRILKELFGKTGEYLYVEPNLKCDYGSNISVGNYFYANFDCIMLDVCPITIGDEVMFGPRVSIFTASHPLDADVRISGLEFGKPVVIGDKVWIGGGAIINPGVTIGDNCVIGSGAVVTKDIPENTIAAGNPCRVIRPITSEDKAYWEKERQLYQDSL
ncbi:sugar O-acetyltransferase [Vagococcus jeotgali]|uniref:sugar O-acetyltransferase n=1 Tax=Vagococcus jeotgali TaxID=3109030 RepID=UPI002DDBF8F9|nr:sugar O-acetyltransferase [Vagococcus sp. B2T-5]